jgi:hypothetical protein
MADVYKNADLNIASLHATNGHGGCFALRDPNLFKPLILESWWAAFGQQSWGWFNIQTHEIDNSPLLRRGWVIQESFLSNRVVNFGKQVVTWRCLESSLIEHTSAEVMWFGFEGTGMSDICDVGCEEILAKWNTLVEEYTRASLTKEEDKLVAFSGIAKTVQQLLEQKSGKTWPYLAGLWQPLLPRELLWRRQASRILLRRPKHYRSPSWSWAAIDAVISLESRDSYEPLYPVTHYLIEVVEARTTPLQVDPFLQIAGAHLQIHCWLCRLDTLDLSQARTRRSSSVYMATGLREDVQLGFTWDVGDGVREHNGSNFLMPVCVRSKRFRHLSDVVQGLVLQPQGTEFKRLGFFQFCYPTDSTIASGTKMDTWDYFIRLVTLGFGDEHLAAGIAKSSYPVFSEDEDRGSLWTPQTIVLV